MARKTFREWIRDISPGWLRGDVGERFMYPFGAILDMLEQWGTDGTYARYPGLGTPTGLSYTGRDRGIRRGISEPDNAFARRQRRTILDKKTAGGAFTLLQQVRGYLDQYAVRVRTVDNSGNWFTIEADGTQVYNGNQGNWDWDSETNPSAATEWSRWWLIIYPLDSGLWPKSPSWGDPALWGGTWEDTPGLCFGNQATPEQVASVRAICREWGGDTGRQLVRIIIAYDEDSFDPEGAPGAPLPDGWWGHQSKVVGGVYVPSRLATARYWRGSAG